MFKTTLPLLIVLAGVGQLFLSIASMAIPKVLDWRRELTAVSPLTRSLFWTYAGYTLGIHLFFAAISIFAPHELTSGGVLATAITGFIALYWGVRLIGQFAWYDRTIVARDRMLFRVAEIAFVALFASLTGDLRRRRTEVAMAVTPAVTMTAIIVATFAVMKVIVLIASDTHLPFGRTLAFIAWPGMRPATFAAERGHHDYLRPMLRGLACVIAGLLLLVVARATAERSLIAAIAIALPAMSLDSSLRDLLAGHRILARDRISGRGVVQGAVEIEVARGILVAALERGIQRP